MLCLTFTLLDFPTPVDQSIKERDVTSTETRNLLYRFDCGDGRGGGEAGASGMFDWGCPESGGSECYTSPSWSDSGGIWSRPSAPPPSPEHSSYSSAITATVAPIRPASLIFSSPFLHFTRPNPMFSSVGTTIFAFAAFLGVLPPPPGGFRRTWDEYIHNENREGWYRAEGYEEMHVQGRRWAGSIKERFNAKKGTEFQGSIYDAGTTFRSYGVPHGSPDLVKAVPEEHKKFLADLVWVHEEAKVSIETSEGISSHKLIAVHGGLETKKDVETQLKMLRFRDTSQPKVANLSGRRDIWDIPKSLANENTILVSGHHGSLHIDGLRLIIDESGGLEKLPLAACILPSKKIVRDTDVSPII